MVHTFVALDLDGTVFPLPHRRVTPTPDRVATTVAVPPRVPPEVAFRPAVVEAITRWAASGARVQWLTSWGRKTRWLDQVGLPALPVLYDPEPGEIFFWDAHDSPGRNRRWPSSWNGRRTRSGWSLDRR